ncbi:AbrB family looped-hinge helix DNA binding protein [Antricoccus suffuscus]|uniref:AbrB family looped-hinge helix DNA binding protein n=2 Tax=Antricoccus suffuscus TaxID=1629062 RepID=A0A2T1A2I1_9ACTN|nr:AbrB family looped-hinge helix DNA binding protein [Antricoccus suffuscus]
MCMRWYFDIMSGTYPVVMGDRGRLVLPAPLRERLRLEKGSPLVLLDTPQGIVIATREQAKKLVRDSLAGDSLVDQLIAERRAAAAVEDVA